MPKYQPYPRREFRRLAAEWRHRNRHLVVGAVVVAVLLLAALTAWCAIFARDSRVAWYALGVSQATVLALVVHVLRTGLLVGDPDALRMLRGAWGEENTRTVLERSKRRRLVWGWVDTIDLQRGDIDHLVVTRRGGVLALDSKWRSQTSRSGIAGMAADAQRAALRATGVTGTVLGRRTKSRHRTQGTSVEVRPVVVVWGSAQHRIPNGAAYRHGVDFVAGRHLRAWIRQLDGEPIDEAAALQLLGGLEAIQESCSSRVTSAG